MFALGIDEVARRVESEFNVWYLDDAALEGIEGFKNLNMG